MTDILRDIIARNRGGAAVAIPSVCSAHPDVLRASLRLAQARDRAVVIEATSNQVNQDGGYTGMTPAAFIAFVNRLADETGTDRARILFGGDHLGPQAWRRLPADQAMAKGRAMVRAYVEAGFSKIHLDCSEGCAGEPAQLGDDITVPRAADLGAVCRDAAADAGALLYVVGTEVPPPGGARHDDDDDHADIPATTPEAARATLGAHMAAFAGIGEIGGLVVQPGVEFTPMAVHHLPLARDPGLMAAIAHHPGVCLEAHSTDYQHPAAFVRLAEIGFAFQKVGPALTFAWRQAVYALDQMRVQAGWGGALVQPAMEALMLADPAGWQGHYHGDAGALRIQRHFGLADRIRYYWPRTEAQATVTALRDDLAGRRLPLPLLAQVFAPQVLERAEALGGLTPDALIAAQVQIALDPYFFATSGGEGAP
ncbi:MAG: class II D-tagatose-bisphosphate aldolase, non-catalytic subunit [Rhodobacterales bacterium]|nr:class II D-tagatose-bisphosphate aldolase, non-catalytic subunit [Rhodobacterales bacterium]NCT11798.1 class II D-tagatose-bisphosphate aldolase, non-catalytic subunit [Rhodobacterales bacterium]